MQTTETIQSWSRDFCFKSQSRCGWSKISQKRTYHRMCYASMFFLQNLCMKWYSHFYLFVLFVSLLLSSFVEPAFVKWKVFFSSQPWNDYKIQRVKWHAQYTRDSQTGSCFQWKKWGGGKFRFVRQISQSFSNSIPLNGLFTEEQERDRFRMCVSVSLSVCVCLSVLSKLWRSG